MHDKSSDGFLFVAAIRKWLEESCDFDVATTAQLRLTLEAQFLMSDIPVKYYREALEVCQDEDQMACLLGVLLRPEYFGDIQSGISYIENILQFEGLHPVTERQQFWIHRTALHFIFAQKTVTSYAYRSLSEVLAFSVLSDASLDAFLGMHLNGPGTTIGFKALDKWYADNPAYRVARELYTEPSTVRTAVEELSLRDSVKKDRNLLPNDLL